MILFVFFYVSGDHRYLHVLTHSSPTRLSSDPRAVVPADADPHRRLAGPLAMLAPARDGIEDAMTALNGPRRVVRPLLHRAEHDQGAVADEFVHGTAEFEHDRRHHLPELRQQLGERIRWQRAAKQDRTSVG